MQRKKILQGGHWWSSYMAVSLAQWVHSYGMHISKNLLNRKISSLCYIGVTLLWKELPSFSKRYFLFIFFAGSTGTEFCSIVFLYSNNNIVWNVCSHSPFRPFKLYLIVVGLPFDFAQRLPFNSSKKRDIDWDLAFGNFHRNRKIRHFKMSYKSTMWCFRETQSSMFQPNPPVLFELFTNLS